MNNIERAKKIKMVVTDVDGVLTDGTINLFKHPHEDRTVEIKRFHSLDGMGLMGLKVCGIKTAIITGGALNSTGPFMKSLGMDYIYYRCFSKFPPLEHLMQKTGLKLDEIAFIGDDIIDLSVIKKIGLACAVPNAVAEVKAAAHLQTQTNGGFGAVREVAEYVLKAQDKWAWFVDYIENGKFTHKPPQETEFFEYDEILEKQ